MKTYQKFGLVRKEKINAQGELAASRGPLYTLLCYEGPNK